MGWKISTFIRGEMNFGRNFFKIDKGSDKRIMSGPFKTNNICMKYILHESKCCP